LAAALSSRRPAALWLSLVPSLAAVALRTSLASLPLLVSPLAASIASAPRSTAPSTAPKTATTAPATDKKKVEKKAKPATGEVKKAPKTKKTTSSAPSSSGSNASPALKKIVKAHGEAPNDVELAVGRALVELEVSTKDLTADLSDLFITAAKEVDAGGKKSVVVFVPFRQHARYKKIQARLVRELEKKLGKHVVLIAQRTILSQAYLRAKKGSVRPRSRTLTTVQNAILEDIVYPTLIVGKRVRVAAEGKKTLKVYLDPKDFKDVEYKVKTFQAVYKKLTNKNVEFIFPAQE